MQIFIATTNRHKVGEISAILSEYGISVKQKSLKILEPDFNSIEEVAKSKAEQAFAKLKKPVIAEDTGVYFDAYHNFPGIFAKRVYEGIGFDGLLSLIRRVKNRSAHFGTAICYYDGKTFKVFSGYLRGKLLLRAVSVDKDRLPYEKLFVPAGYSNALVNLDIKEKNRISHRALATRKLAKWLVLRKGK
ncbi:MAG TPA: non-canonical purine NTP pyrophosphatase [archaeon]|nr:non-canonical purine NTP pyrophosphatase [archaeon]